jgi:hypothetical protein
MILTKRGLSVIIHYAVDKVAGDSRSAYLRKIAHHRYLPCSKCDNRIEIGQEYQATHGKATRSASRKYYHPICFKSLFH